MSTNFDIYISYLNKFDKIQLSGNYKVINRLKRIIGWQDENFFMTYAYRKYGWDGWNSFITDTNKAPYGSISWIVDILRKERINCYIDKNLFPIYDDYSFIKSIKTGEFKPREDQYDAVEKAIKSNRSIIVASTSYGKSLVIYLLCSYHLQYNRNTIIVVPTQALVEQMQKDIISYGYTGDINGIYAQKKRINSSITVITFQTLAKIPSILNNFDNLIIDECHRIKSKSLLKVIKTWNKRYMTGFTGTLKEKSHEWSLAKAYIGKPYVITNTMKLIENKIVANLTVNIIRLLYPKEIRQKYKNLYFRDELDFYYENEKRNLEILKIACEKNKTGMIAVKMINHCIYLHELMEKYYPDRVVYEIRGNFNYRNREEFNSLDELKPLIEKEEKAILIVSLPVFSTGISLKNIYFGIMAASTKSYVTVIQTIGRGLRVNEVKKDFMFIDILDDLREKTDDETYAYSHYLDRLSYYEENNFPIIKSSINL